MKIHFSTLVTVLFLISVAYSFAIWKEEHIIHADHEAHRDHIARNIIIGTTIRVCSRGYDNATAAAVNIINSSLYKAKKGTYYTNAPVYEFRPWSECQHPANTAEPKDRILDVIVVDTASSDKTNWCSSGAPACVKRMHIQQSSAPYYSYTGQMRISIMSDRMYPTSVDVESDPLHPALIRTVTHELLHPLGFIDLYEVTRREYLARNVLLRLWIVGKAKLI